MTHIIRIKRSTTPGGAPQNLAYGELAYNFADGLLYIGGPDGQPHQIAAGSAVEVGQLLELRDQASSTAAVPLAPAPTNGYTSTGVRRRLLPFED